MDISSGSTIGWGDLTDNSRNLLEMHKDVANGIYQYDWPAPGSKESIELIADADPSIKFYFDIWESSRSSSVIVGLSSNRKSKLQTRASNSPLIRIDFITNRVPIAHINPDGGEIHGTHVHLDVGESGLRWAFPLSSQSVVEIKDSTEEDFESILDAFLNTCSISENLTLQLPMGV